MGPTATITPSPAEESYWSKAGPAPSDESYWSKATDSSNPQADVDQPSREVYTAEDRLNSDQQIAHATDTRPVIQRGPNAPGRFDLGPSPVPSNPGQSLFRQEVEQQKGAPLAITPAGAVPVPEGTPVGAPPKPMVPGLELGTDHVVAHDPTTGAVIPSRNPLDAGRPITDEDAAQRAEFGKQLANPEQVGNQIAPGFGSMADAPVELAKGNVKGAAIKALGGAGEFGSMAIAPEALEIAASAEFGPAIKLAVALGGGQAGDSVIRKVGAERGWKPEDIELASQAVQWLPAGIYAGARLAGVKTVGGEIPKAEPGTDLPSEAGVNAPEPGTKFKGVTAFPDKETGRPRVAAGVSTSPEGERTAAVRVGETSVGIDLSRKGAKPSEESYWKPAAEAPEGESERPVVQASDNPEELRKSAAAQQPDLEQSVKAVTSQVPGTDLEGSRVKDADSQANKEDRGKPNETNIDHLGARVSADTPEARAKVEQAVREQLPVVSEDKIDANHTDATQFGIKTGENGDANQVSELQVVDKPMAQAMKETDSLYDQQKQALAAGDEQKAHDIGTQIAEIHKAAQSQVGGEDDLEQARRGAAAQPEVPSQLSTNGVPKEQRASTQIARDEQQKMGERIAGRNETKAAIEKPAEEKPTKYKFGNTQANIPDDSEAAQSLNTVRQRISKLDLAGKGKDIGDGGNHVTVRYGIQGEDTEGIKRYIESLSPFDASLGKTETFPPSEHSDGAAVIQAPINSPELHKINGEIQKHGDFAPSSFPDYAPHATIAYVKPEKAQRYVGMTVTNGKKFHVDQIAIAKKDGSQEIVKLKGAGSAAGPSAVSKTTSEGSSPSAPAKAPEHPIALPAEAQEELKKPGSFIGVDLDKTLAKYDEWKGKTNIGEPIENTVNQVKQWLAEGKDVKIFTARVADDPGGIAKRAIEDWTEKHLGKRLDVTNEKSPHMVAQVDDRGIHVAPNEGIPTGGEHAVPERRPEAILQREPAENRPESGGRIQQREQRNESARPRAAQGNEGDAVQKEEVAREITSATSSVPSISSDHERRVLEGISRMLERGARNDAVRSVVEELSDDQVDPHPIMEEFWNSTYPALPEKGKRQFEHQISSMIGLKPGDVISVNAKQGTHQVAKSWREIVDGGLAKKTGDMEHGEQAVVGLAQILNEMRRKAESGIPIAEAQKAISGKEEGTVKSRHGKIIDISSGEHGRTGTQAVGTAENSNRGVVPTSVEHAEKPGQRSNLLEFKSQPQVYRTDSKEKVTGRVITFTPKAAPRVDHIGDLNHALELESTDPDAAAAIYKSLIDTGDKHIRASAYVNLAVLRSINGKFAEAGELTKKAVEIDPNFAQARFNLASYLEDSGRAREAIIEYEKAKRLAPQWADPYYNLARAYQRLRDSTKALKNYRAFLTLESGTPFSEHARHEITRLTEHMTLINGGGNSVDTTAAQEAHLSVVTQGTVKKVEGSNKRSLAARVANDPDVAKLQPKESVEKGKNFEGRYLRATLEPVKTAWMKAVSNTRGDSADDHWKWMVKHVTAPDEAVRPDGYKQDSIYAGIPGDGAFLIPNTPRAIEHALRSADRFGTSIKQTSQLPAKTSVPRSPKEFDNAKYVSNLKEEIADLEKGISRASHTTTPHLEYLKESLKLAKENLADATKGGVTLRSGFLDPELFKQIFPDPAQKFKDWISDSLTPAKEQKAMMRETRGEKDRQVAIQAERLKQVQRAWRLRSRDESIDFFNSVESGTVQSLPERDRKLAQTFKDAFDQMKDELHGLKPELLRNYIKNYFPHIWERPSRAVNVIRQIMSGKRPFAGSGAFLKKRTIPTIQDGLNLGFKPVSWNPVDLFMLKYNEMAQFLMAHKTLEMMKDAGTAEYVKAGEAHPQGWTQLDDRISTVWRRATVLDDKKLDDNTFDLTWPGAAKKTAQPAVFREDVPSYSGMVIAGHYYAPPDAARVFNNFVSKGMAGRSAIFDAANWLNSNLNALQLGISAFHATTTTVNAATSDIALGIQEATQGKLSALKDLGQGLTVVPSLISTLRNGSHLMREYLNPGSYEKFAKEAEAVATAGGRIKQNTVEVSALDKVVNDFRNGAIADGLSHIPGAIIHATTWPVMNYYVPRMKMGAFYDMAHNILDTATKEGWSQDQTRDRMQKAWDSIDNRFGQMVYDNLFWNKALRDSLMLATRSVGWNYGTIRELGGAPVDFVREGAKAAGGEKPEVTDRMAFAFALAAFTALMGAALTRMWTGKAPDTWKDYYYPKTEDGTRVSIPGYMKDVFSYGHHPVNTVANKMGPLAEMTSEAIQNRDFYGTEIRHKDDGAIKQFYEVAHWFAQSAEPFSFSGSKKLLEKEGEDTSSTLSTIKAGLRHPGDVLRGQLGFQPAPAYIQNSPALNKARDYEAENLPPGTRTQAQTDRRQAMNAIEAMFRNRDVNEDTIKRYVEEGKITQQDVNRARMMSKTDPLVFAVRGLSLDQALNVYKEASPKEKEVLRRVLQHKIVATRREGKAAPSLGSYDSALTQGAQTY